MKARVNGSSLHEGATTVSGKRSTKPSKASASARRGRADLARLRAIRETEIARTSPPELADLPADFWANATIAEPVAKQAISLRVDEDVLAWFRGLGPRYQTRMNAVLRSYMTQTGKGRADRRPQAGKKGG